jgi:thiol-disulfide isomerase/thioredoxin
MKVRCSKWMQAWFGRRDGARCRWRGVALALLSGFLLAGCGKVDLGQWANLARGGEVQGSAADVEGEDGSASELGPAGLTGKTVSDVRSILGQPLGRLRTQEGTVWLYPDWRIEMDGDGRVTSVEREGPVRVEARAAAGGSVVGPVTVISEGGREVDLSALLPVGKVAIVDFYADWCGPCRKISPHLEQLAKNDPEVVLIKVDIVKWDTPVARQHQIRSVPNIRVYNGRGQVVGSPTSDLNAVRRNIEQAKRT